MVLSEFKKRLLREFCDFTCEECGKTELELSSQAGKVIKLEIHRVKQGGEYSLRNVKVICHDCHKIFNLLKIKHQELLHNGKRASKSIHI